MRTDEREALEHADPPPAGQSMGYNVHRTDVILLEPYELLDQQLVLFQPRGRLTHVRFFFYRTSCTVGYTYVSEDCYLEIVSRVSFSESAYQLNRTKRIAINVSTRRERDFALRDDCSCCSTALSSNLSFRRGFSLDKWIDGVNSENRAAAHDMSLRIL